MDKNLKYALVYTGGIAAGAGVVILSYEFSDDGNDFFDDYLNVNATLVNNIIGTTSITDESLDSLITEVEVFRDSSFFFGSKIDRQLYKIQSLTGYFEETEAYLREAKLQFLEIQPELKKYGHRETGYRDTVGVLGFIVGASLGTACLITAGVNYYNAIKQRRLSKPKTS